MNHFGDKAVAYQQFRPRYLNEYLTILFNLANTMIVLGMSKRGMIAD